MPRLPQHHLIKGSDSFRTKTTGTLLFVAALGYLACLAAVRATAIADATAGGAAAVATTHASAILPVLGFCLIVGHGIFRPVGRLYALGVKELGSLAGIAMASVKDTRELDWLAANITTGLRNLHEYTSDRNHQVKAYLRRFLEVADAGHAAAARGFALLVGLLTEDMALKAGRVSIDDLVAKKDPAKIIAMLVDTCCDPRIEYHGPSTCIALSHSAATEFTGLAINLIANATTHGTPNTSIQVTLTHHDQHITLEVANHTSSGAPGARAAGSSGGRHGNDGDRDTVRRLNGTLTHRHDEQNRTYTVIATLPVPD